MKIDFDNPAFGYVIFVDEIGVVFKDIFYSPRCADFITFLSQIRKLGIYIIGTSQIYSRLDKLVREFFRLNGQLVYCSKFLPGITLQRYVDMTTCTENSKNELNFEVEHKNFLYHTPELYECYDTFAIISQIKSIGKKGVETLNAN